MIRFLILILTTIVPVLSITIPFYGHTYYNKYYYSYYSSYGHKYDYSFLRAGRPGPGRPGREELDDVLEKMSGWRNTVEIATF